MERWRGLLIRIAGMRRDDQARIDEEMQEHLRLLAEEHRRRGLTPSEAAREARLAFGNPAVVREAYRDQRRLPAVESLFQDVRYAARLLRRHRGFTLAAGCSG